MSIAHPTTHAAHDHGPHAPGHDKLALLKKVPTFSTDHKVIGVQFLITTLLMLLVGGALALGVRWQLAFPWETMPV
ncbi:MAG: cytochrome c oxidase subunit I, partial [Planctomycetaceae bacterium]